MKWRDLFIFLTILLVFTGCTIAQQVIPIKTSAPTSTATTAPTATITPTPEPKYTLCPNIENFRDCYVSEKELLDGNYWDWLNEIVAPALLEEFKAREDQIKYIEPHVVGALSGSVFIYGHPNNPAYEDPETRPWERNVTFAYTSVKENGNNLDYIVLPVFYYVKETRQVYPVVSVIPIRNQDAIPGIEEMYLESMNIPALIYSESYGQFEKDNIVMNDEIVGQVYNRIGLDEMWDRIQRFRNGDVSAFSDPDIVVSATMSGTDAFK